jgi:hypothetical protein
MRKSSWMLSLGHLAMLPQTCGGLLNLLTPSCSLLLIGL